MVYRLMSHLGVTRAAPRLRIKYNKSKRYDDFNRRIGSSCYRVFQKVASSLVSTVAVPVS